MKKIFYSIPLLFITLFAYVNNVNADSSTDLYLYMSNYSYTDTYNFYSTMNYNFSDIYSVYLSDYSSTYPFYIYSGTEFILFSSVPVLNELYTDRYFLDYSYTLTLENNTVVLNSSSSSFELLDFSGSDNYMFPTVYLYSNFNLAFPSGYSSFDLYYYYNNSVDTSARSYTVSSSEGIPTFSSYLNLDIFNDDIADTFTEINLNDYSYIILTLRDYSLRNSNNNQFSTNIYTYGKLCLTSVYNYGMTQKNQYYTDYQTPACSIYYNTYTPVPVYILKSDLINKAVYYISSSDYSVINSIKVDPSIFDIYYFTSETADNPSIVINGRTYPPLPYSDLTDTAIISTDNGYISGQVCAIGDINCSYDEAGIDITNLFSSPLTLLQTIWSSIGTFFMTINTFILILPPVLQTFLYISFMLAVLLGIIKIIIG